jgi:hypothetical protein
VKSLIAGGRRTRWRHDTRLVDSLSIGVIIAIFRAAIVVLFGKVAGIGPREVLAIAGQPQNDRYDPASHYSNHMRYDPEIDANLRTNHWQNEKNANQNNHPIGF